MGRFDVEVTGDEVQFGKPAPDLFLLAAERLGVLPQSCVVFEDTPAGLEAAARAGMRRVWVPNVHTRHRKSRSRSTRRWRVSRTRSTGFSPKQGRIR